MRLAELSPVVQRFMYHFLVDGIRCSINGLPCTTSYATHCSTLALTCSVRSDVLLGSLFLICCQDRDSYPCVYLHSPHTLFLQESMPYNVFPLLHLTLFTRLNDGLGYWLSLHCRCLLTLAAKPPICNISCYHMAHWESTHFRLWLLNIPKAPLSLHWAGTSPVLLLRWVLLVLQVRCTASAEHWWALFIICM